MRQKRQSCAWEISKCRHCQTNEFINTSSMTSILTGAVQHAALAAHAGVASLIASAQVQPGASIPPVTVKENDPNESFSLDNISGRNVIVCSHSPTTLNIILTNLVIFLNRSVFLGRLRRHAAPTFPGTSKGTRSSRRRALKTYMWSQ